MAPGTVRLVGREPLLSSVEAFLARAAGGAATLRLSGGPGVGKTALLDAAAASAAAEGMVVLRAAGVRPESGIDFATLHQLLHPLRRCLTSLPALSAALGFGSGAEGDLFAEIAGLLRRHAAGAPILLVIDDWHWVDPRSGEVLTELGRSLVGLLTANVEAAGPDILDVPPLDEAHAEILLSERFPTLAASVGRRLCDQARGNPLALLELAESLNEEQRLGRRPLPPASGRFHDLCVSRVEELPGAERRRLLLDALGDSADRLDPLMRSAVVRSSTGEERATAHRELARRAADEPERRARHLAEATVGADESVAASLQDSARRAMRTGDAPGAVAALLRAADLSADGARRSRRLAEAAYVGANVGGDLRTAPGLLNAARHADPRGYGSLPVAVAAAHLLFNNDGHIETAHRLLTATVGTAVAGSADDDPMLVEALYQLADVCFYAARDDLWPGLEDTLSRLGPTAPDLLRMYVHTLRSPVLLTASDRLRLDTALRDSSNGQDPSMVYRISRIAIACNRLSECRPALDRIVDDGRAGGAVGLAINAMMLLSADDMTTGRLDRADALAAEAIQLCETRGYELMEGPFQVIRIMVAARRGQVDGVREPAMRVAAWAVPRGVRPLAQYCDWGQATAAMARGDFEEAYHHCVALAVPGVLPLQTPMPFRSSLDLIESALRTGRRTEAVAHARAIAASGMTQVSPAFGLLTLAAGALVTEDHAEAEALFVRALSVPGADDLEWDQARVRLLFGERLRRARAVTQARAPLEAALAAFERMGATPWAARAARELEATAATRARAHEPGKSSLTPQETQVAALAAAGLSNKQIGAKLLMSHRTVGAHLSRAYGKLGVSGRAALSAALADIEAAR